MDARSALFDVYGDHLRSLPGGEPEVPRGQAPVAALVRLMAPLGLHAPAVRTAVSRMVRQGWLTAVRLPAGPGYALTPRALRRLDDSADRVYRTSVDEWDGRWHLIVVTPPGSRTDRERLYSQLSFFGYGALGGSTCTPGASSCSSIPPCPPLLPPGWPGGKAAACFDEEAATLFPAARRFVVTCLEKPHV